MNKCAFAGLLLLLLLSSIGLSLPGGILSARAETGIPVLDKENPIIGVSTGTISGKLAEENYPDAEVRSEGGKGGLLYLG